MYLDNDILLCDVAKNDGLLHVRLCPRPGILMRQLKFQNEKIKYSRINWNRKEENKEWGNYWNL